MFESGRSPHINSFINFSGKGRANWQFAWLSRKAALKESRQTGSLPYTRAAISLFQDVVRDDLNGSSQESIWPNKIHSGKIRSYFASLSHIPGVKLRRRRINVICR
jgi:hypothetical protein